MQSLAFSFYLLSVRGNDTKFSQLEAFFQLEWKPDLDVWLCTEGGRKSKSLLRKMYEEKQTVFFSETLKSGFEVQKVWLVRIWPVF